jgi:hypothetical protein
MTTSYFLGLILVFPEPCCHPFYPFQYKFFPIFFFKNCVYGGLRFVQKVSIYQTARNYIPEGSIRSHCRRNQKSHKKELIWRQHGYFVKTAHSSYHVFQAATATCLGCAEPLHLLPVQGRMKEAERTG